MTSPPGLLQELLADLNAPTARLAVAFPLFLPRPAPVSGATADLDYDCSFLIEGDHERTQLTMTVRVPVTTLCPCSKAISDYGAHNQRGYLTIKVQPAPQAEIWLEELIALGEQCGSAPVYPLLKRVDERYVTMQAYDNPVFVEDMVRNAAVALMADPRVAAFHVEAENVESIHNHNAFAEVAWTRL